jgi:hypothetical protein
MLSLLRVVVILFVLLLVGGAVLLATMDLQPPTQRVVKTLPNDRFQR